MTRTAIPRIGIPIRLTPPSDAEDDRVRAAERVFEDIVALIADGGAEPVRLRPEVMESDRLLESCDGFVLPGGGDVDPRGYAGDADDPTLFGVHPLQDAFDIAVADFASRTGRPLLAICRGMQLVNVARGGTLHVDLAPTTVVHYEECPPSGEVAWSHHDVAIEMGTRTAGLFDGRLSLPVACSHHQAIKQMGEGLRVTARAVDGCIEAVESSDDDSWLVGVQWHPEADYPTGNPDRVRLFAGLTEQARRRRDVSAPARS